jgi:hypothetical protein
VYKTIKTYLLAFRHDDMCHKAKSQRKNKENYGKVTVLSKTHGKTTVYRQTLLLVVIQTVGLQTNGFLYVRGNEPERERLCRDGGGIRSGLPWHLHGRLDSGRASSSVKEVLQGPVVNSGMEGISELGL